MPVVNYFNGTSLVSNGFAPHDVEVIFQKITAQMLGYDPLTVADPAYARVRIVWQTDGQPAFKLEDDTTWVRAVERQETYGKIFDAQYGSNPLDPSATTCLQTIKYQRTWGLHWAFYGPDAGWHAQLVHDGLILDWVRNSVAQSGLYLIPEMVRPQRTKELYSGRWWERFDLANIGFNELVTDTLVLSTIGSAEILVYTTKGLVADLTADNYGYNEGGAGQGPFGGPA